VVFGKFLPSDYFSCGYSFDSKYRYFFFFSLSLGAELSDLAEFIGSRSLEPRNNEGRSPTARVEATRVGADNIFTLLFDFPHVDTSTTNVAVVVLREFLHAVNGAAPGGELLTLFSSTGQEDEVATSGARLGSRVGNVDEVDAVFASDGF